jgi:hypothetical protein
VPSRGTVVSAARLLAPPLRRPGHAVAAAATRAERVIPHDCDCTRTQGSAHRKQYPAPPPPDHAQGGWWRQRWPARISRQSNPSTTVGSALTNKKYKEHDLENRFRVGDVMELRRPRPISKTKHSLPVLVQPRHTLRWSDVDGEAAK